MTLAAEYLIYGVPHLSTFPILLISRCPELKLPLTGIGRYTVTMNKFLGVRL